ncbi:hypothetical protein [Sphingobium sp. TCM1]|uniref:hypothetical protein n=1 Tax=Sphingobium sp. TCM1 TaxID=453246 RepID=UPI0007F3CEA2|nr:hypothetical protein [Sphingobium sp. TCM1]OAN56214.1 hypothetical protein A7Q26_02050 [Sphingobium sp. TCM1]
MFQGHGGLAIEGEHLDISYADKEAWPRLTEKGSLRAFIFGIGDVDAGPMIQLGLVTKRDDEPLDWRHSIDPLHHHGSDQFRTLMRGEWSLAGRRLHPGDYSFQESGMVYQEHPIASENWMMLVMGDRRGNQATIATKKDEATVFEYDEIYGAPVTGKAYPLPEGNRGTTAIATTAGLCVRGFVNGRGETLAAGAVVSGLLGDASAGPAVHVVKAGAGDIILPESQWDTELLIAVVAGSVQVGDSHYATGEIRVQRERAKLRQIVSGDAGAEVVLVRGDRRAAVSVLEGDVPTWVSDAAGLSSRLEPRPGGKPL